MKKRTMQEVADFFGCYVGKDSEDSLGGNFYIWIFNKEPRFSDGE